MTDRLIFVFAHIPKTAGTTVSDMLRRNFGQSMISMPHAFLEGNVPSDRIDHWLRIQPHLRCLSGHRFNLDLPWASSEFDFRVISFIRDPIDRLYSEYRYIRKAGIADATGLARDSTSFNAFATRICENDNAQVKGQSQYWFLTNGAKMGRAEINKLVDEGKLLIYPTHGLDEASVLLKSRFPSAFRDASTRTLNINPNQRSPSVVLEAEVREELKKRLADDYWLVDLSNRCLDNHVSEVSDAIFREQLRKLKRTKIVRRWIKSPLLTYASRLENLLSRW